MPVKVKKIGNLFRVVEVSSGNIATTKNNVAVDGGGHKSKAKASRQQNAINTSLTEGNIGDRDFHK